jgi:hypothetical protein
MENQVENEAVTEDVTAPEADTPVVESTEEKVVTPADEVEALVADRLAKMKENMDRMSKERDDALKMKADMEAKAKEDAIARMKEEGKLQEALEMELADARAKLASFEEQNVKLSRDNVLNQALAGMEFRNDKSRDMARREIVEQLTQGEEGAWMHSSGLTISDFVESYAKSEDNSFLFRTKNNSGAGTGTPAGAPSTDIAKSIGEMSTTEILALAAKGKLGNFNL